jgi:hypothetical protein
VLPGHTHVKRRRLRTLWQSGRVTFGVTTRSTGNPSRQPRDHFPLA